MHGGVLASLRGGAVNPGRGVTLADKIGGEADTHSCRFGGGGRHEENRNDPRETSSEILPPTVDVDE